MKLAKAAFESAAFFFVRISLTGTAGVPPAMSAKREGFSWVQLSPKSFAQVSGRAARGPRNELEGLGSTSPPWWQLS